MNSIISKYTLNASGVATATDSGNAGNAETIIVDVTAVTGTSIVLPINSLHKVEDVMISGYLSTGVAKHFDGTRTITNPTSGTGKPTVTIEDGTNFVLANLEKVVVRAVGGNLA